jgi:hypothetical protein
MLLAVVVTSEVDLSLGNPHKKKSEENSKPPTHPVFGESGQKHQLRDWC